MTNEEALKHIMPRLKFYIQCTDDNIALHKAVEALEKQIPKKPIKQEITLYLSKATDVLCPMCNKSVCTWITLNSHSKKVPYCRFCGQALDWSEENANNS